MFKKTSQSGQLNMFTSAGALFSGNSLKMYEDKQAWHNQFREQVTNRIDEEIFRPLYCGDNGTPNAPVRVLISMMVLKEAEGLSDRKIFEECRFNILTRSAIGLHNVNDPLPTESTYYLFRKRVHDYAEAHGENLFETVFAQITKSQCAEFEISGKRIRMDSKLLSSNIAWLSRYELVHETLRMFYNQVKHSKNLDKTTKNKLDGLLKMEGNKVVYTCSSEEVKGRFRELGKLIYKILHRFPTSSGQYYQALHRVFNEQYKVGEKKAVVPRDKKEISAKSVQSPHDTDCHYRDKDGQKVKGYSINITESCDEENRLNLIGHVDVRKASTPDVDFLGDDIEKAREVFNDKIETAHADGAYHSPGNQGYCNKNGIKLCLHAIQGAKGRYQLEPDEKGGLSVFDSVTNEHVDCVIVNCKNGDIKWRIKTGKRYRYFTSRDIESCQLRKKIENTPIEELQKRNNVEASIFQLGYHYPNAKSRYRGEIKHQMWANVRCLWVNFVRILKYVENLRQKTNFRAKNRLKSIFRSLYFESMLLFTVIFTNNRSLSENIRFSFL